MTSEELTIPIPLEADGQLASAGAGVTHDGEWAVYFYVNGSRQWLPRRFAAAKQAIAYSRQINLRSGQR